MKSIVAKPNFTTTKLSFGEITCFGYNKPLKDELSAGLTGEDRDHSKRRVSALGGQAP